MIRRVRQHYPRISAFVGRRLAAGEYLGLHLTIGLLLSLGMLGLFGVVAHSIGGPAEAPPLDRSVGRQLEAHRRAAPMVRNTFLAITWAGDKYVIAPLAALVALLLMLRRRLYLALVWMFAMIGGGLLDGALKLYFGRQRPDFGDSNIHPTSPSFPSGHSMGSLVFYGMLAYLLFLTLRGLLARTVTVAALALLALAIGFSRLYLGAHYLSDVVGGYAVGAFWLVACISAIETVRRRPRRVQVSEAREVVADCDIRNSQSEARDRS